jgi:ubiquinone/menaquinone biosynthesis C-methylase UbiE
MAELSRRRVKRWADRAEIRVGDGTAELGVPDRSQDRFIAAYVLDLLSEEDIARVLEQARRALVPDGLLCLVSLTHGQGPVSGAVSAAWTRLHRLRPSLVGGCRPISLADYVHAMQWRVCHRDILCAWGVCSDVLVAERRG